MLRRNWKGGEDSVENRERVLSRLRSLASRAERENDPERLLGREGEAAALYFGEFRHLISTGRNLRGDFTWAKRSRRPPTDRSTRSCRSPIRWQSVPLPSPWKPPDSTRCWGFSIVPVRGALLSLST